jgi:hypothetical protein
MTADKAFICEAPNSTASVAFQGIPPDNPISYSIAADAVEFGTPLPTQLER